MTICSAYRSARNDTCKLLLETKTNYNLGSRFGRYPRGFSTFVPLGQSGLNRESFTLRFFIIFL